MTTPTPDKQTPDPLGALAFLYGIASDNASVEQEPQVIRAYTTVRAAVIRAAQDEDNAQVRAERDSAQEHIAYHLHNFRPVADMKATGDLAVDMAAYAGRMRAERDAVRAALAAHHDTRPKGLT